MSAAVRDSDAPRLLSSDKYEIERVLGRGGMGTVFEARHTRLGQRVAIKVLGDDLRAHPELVTRFEREARAAGALSSPHAVRVFDIDQDADGTPFIIMELLEGRDLGYVVERSGAQPVGRAVRWIIEACDAIGEAHRLGIIHRDIKPSNLFLCQDSGTIKVLDFGIAKRMASKEASVTAATAPLGTPQYMSPEQVRCAKDVDARSDVWSLGVTLYELVCGRPPFDHEVPQACIAAIVVDPVPDPRELRADLPDGLARALLRALAKAPEERFQSVDELVLDLAPFADAMDPEHGALRAVTMARRTAAHSSATLASETKGDGGEPRHLEPRRDRVRSGCAPALARAVAPTRRRRAALALACASALALFAFPKWGGTHVEGAASDRPAPRAPATALNGASDELPRADRPPRPAAPRPAPPSVAPHPRRGNQLVQRASVGAPASSAVGEGDTAVHGGISGPGF